MRLEKVTAFDIFRAEDHLSKDRDLFRDNID